jgi:hypothetical protein
MRAIWFDVISGNKGSDNKRLDELAQCDSCSDDDFISSL